MGHHSVKTHSSGISIIDRHSELSIRFCRTGQAVLQTNPVLSVRPVEVVPNQPVGLDPHSTIPDSTPSVVAKRGSSPTRSTSPSPNSFHSTHLRCQSGRLGSPLGTSGSDNIRSLVSTGVQTSHQQPRNESCQPSHLSLQTPGSEPLRHVVNRQHDSGIVHSPPRRHTVEITRSRNDRSPPTLSEPEDSSSCQAHSRQIECLGGRTVQKESDSSHRMDNSAGDGQSDLPQIGTTNGRSVCDSSQQQTPSLREPSLQPINMGDRRAFVRIWSWSHRLPPTESGYRAPVTGHRECPVRAFARYRAQGLTGHRVLLLAPWWPRQTWSNDLLIRLSKKSTRQARPTIPERDPPHGYRHVPPTRLTVIKQSLRKKRFSTKAFSLIASARRPSTRAVYDSRWKVFTDWCVREQINPLNPSPRRIADFLVFLFDTKNLSLSSIKGYRSMISHTLAFHKASKACSDPAISELIRALELKRPVSRSLTPKWDLSCVLWSLTKAPYEPLDQASLQFLTWKQCSF